MKNYIINKFKNVQTNQTVGTDGRYHTVYYIEFDSGHYYIGKHSTSCLDNDRYFCSGKLALKLKECGTPYQRSVLFYLSDAESAIQIEKNILQIKKVFDAPLCLNCNCGHVPDVSGYIIISKGHTFKMVNPKMVDYYLEQGWQQKGIKRVYITDGIQNKMVLPDHVDSYLASGWILGNSSAKDCIFVKKNGKLSYIKKSLLEQYISDGWEYHHNQQDYKVIKKDGKLKKVPSIKLAEYLDCGYELSSTVADLIYIKRENSYKRVPLEEVNAYINDGWTRGNPTSGKIYVYNEHTEKRISIDDLEKYESSGWVKGRIKKIYLTDGISEKRISYNDDIKLHYYINLGFTIGKLNRTRAGT